MKRKDLWKELNMNPQPKKPSRTASPLATPDPTQQEAAQQALRSNCVRALLSALSTTSDQPEVGPGDVDPGNARGACSWRLAAAAPVFSALPPPHPKENTC